MFIKIFSLFVIFIIFTSNSLAMDVDFSTCGFACQIKNVCKSYSCHEINETSEENENDFFFSNVNDKVCNVCRQLSECDGFECVPLVCKLKGLTEDEIDYLPVFHRIHSFCFI